MLYAEATILDPRLKNDDFLNQHAFIEDKKPSINKASTVNTANYAGEQPNEYQSNSESVGNDFDTEVNT